MSDTRKILEQGIGSFAPQPGGYERVVARQSRKRRNEKIATILVALAITTALIVIGTSVRHRGATVPASPVPTVRPVGPGLSLVDPATGRITPLSQARIARTLNGLDISPDGSEIAFTRRVSGRYGFQIFVMGADGGGIRQLTHQPLGAYAPAWSPSGDRIAFISYVGKDAGGGDLFVMDADGSSVRLVARTKNINERDVAWSPDGSRLAFEGFAAVGDGIGIGITDIRTGVTSLFSRSGYALLSSAVEPAWSPDGNWIAFQGDTDPGFEDGRIWLMHPDGTDAHVLVDVGGGRLDPQYEESSPKWSPDGRQIAYCESIPRTDGCSIASIDVATATVRTVTTNATYVFDWSPRGYLVVLGGWG